MQNISIDYHKAQFLLSVARLAQLPSDEGVEVAFAGRSNAGKSSALNVLTNNKRLARTSKTPGRTQHINIFTLNEHQRLADLPGYGYAKVPLTEKHRWQQLLHTYLETRDCLRGLVLLMDIRHPLKEFDINMLDWAYHAQLPVHILLTKADKLTRGKALNIFQQVSKELKPYTDLVSIQTFSAPKKTGVDDLKVQLEKWFVG